MPSSSASLPPVELAPAGATVLPLKPINASPQAGWSAGNVLATALVLVALYVGRDVFIPVALALLLSVALLPLSRRVQKLGVPRAASVLVVILGALTGIGGLLLLFAVQVIGLAEDLPRYEQGVRAKLATLGGGGGMLERTMAALRHLSDDLSGASSGTTTGPVPVLVTQAPDPQSPVLALLDLAKMVAAPAASIAIALLLLTYFLLQREDVRDRFLRLTGLRDLHRTTRALADATERVGSYLLMQVVVNGSFGFGMGVGLYFVGVPNAPLWGLLGFAFRFIPFLGAPLSMVLPLFLAFATGVGWTAPLLVIGLYLLVDGVATYVLEPLLYGRSTGISPLALLVCSAFWTVLWGPVGLVLAPPITTCLVIIGRHVPAFAFLEVALGDSEALPPPVRFYQRFLADDAEGAAEVADEYAAANGFSSVLTELVFPALDILRQDRREGVFVGADLQRIGAGIAEVVQSLEEISEAATPVGPPIEVVGLAGPLDRAVAVAVAAGLRQAGHAAVFAEGPGMVGSGEQRSTLLCTLDAPSGPRLRRMTAAASRAGGGVSLLVLGDVQQQQLAPIAALGFPILRSLAAAIAGHGGQRAPVVTAAAAA